MFYQANENSVSINGINMSYVNFGYGKEVLVILPGLVDGLKSVRGQAAVLALSFRQLAKKFRVYVFSRKDEIEKSYTTKDMSKDQKLALDQLGINQCYVMGVSQGGMIAQHLAIEYPHMVKKLILAVSTSRASDVLCNVIHKWIGFAQENDYKSLIIDTLEKTYSPKKLKTYRLAYPIISRIGKPKNFDRFIIQANACLIHNTYNELDKITCPTLIIGGDSDNVVGAAASPEMADNIPINHLLIYSGLGHAAYEEGKDFNNQVLDFLENRTFR